MVNVKQQFNCAIFLKDIEVKKRDGNTFIITKGYHHLKDRKNEKTGEIELGLLTFLQKCADMGNTMVSVTLKDYTDKKTNEDKQLIVLEGFGK